MASGWREDYGYCGCKVKRFDEIAVAVFEEDGSWGYQAFDEGNEDAILHGETIAEGYGFASEAAVIGFVEGCMA